MARPGRRRIAIAAAVAAAVCAAVAIATSATAQDRERPARRLHTDLPSPNAPTGEFGDIDVGGLAQELFGSEPRASKNPTAIASTSNRMLPEPSTDAPAAPEEVVHGRSGYGADRITEWNADYQTGSDGTLHYVTVFNPSVIPFKRMTALDSVDSSFVLRASGGATTRDQRVGGRHKQNEDVFWASLVVNLKPGEEIPIPSVSPDMRVLSYEATPATNLVFSKDNADNYYLRSDESDATGEFRVVFLAAAPASYFAPEIPRRYTVAQALALAEKTDPALVPEIPVNVRTAALQALQHPRLGLTRRSRLDIAVDKLVAYFRSFEAREPPPRGENIYLDLFASRAGVCRHRSYAFAITANALGIPSRYVANEAHAWVEIWVPKQGWTRIDLGGAALRLQVSNADGKSMHQPRGEDPFPKPRSYSENYTRLEGDVSGLTQDQLKEARERRPGSDGASGDGASGDGDSSFSENGDDGDDSFGTPTGPGRTMDEIPAEELAGKTPTRFTDMTAAAEGFRGESIDVGGRLVDERGAGIPNLRVDIWLAPAGQGGDSATLIGRTVTGSEGRFRAQVSVPTEIPLEAHEVYASTPGDSVHQPSVSQ